MQIFAFKGGKLDEEQNKMEGEGFLNLIPFCDIL